MDSSSSQESPNRPSVDLKEQNNQESTGWYSLADDLKVEILFLLPEKSLIPLKRVSKDWYFVISYACIPLLSPPSLSVPICGVFGPCFTDDKSKSSNVVYSPYGHYFDLYYSRYGRAEADIFATYLDTLPFTCTTEDLLDCCNGFLLVSHSISVPTQYLVCNPATRLSIHVPVNSKHQNSILVDCSLVFDPTESLDYKIIRFVHSAGKATIRLLDVFDSKTEEWIEYELPLEPEVSGLGSLKSSVYLNGVLYRLSGAGCLVCIDIKSNTDLGNLNAWATIEPPNQHTSDEGHVGSIGSSRGDLYYFIRVASDFLLWALKDGSEWVLKYSLNMYGLDKGMGRYYFEVLGDKIPSTIQPYALLPGSHEILFETPWFLATCRLDDKHFELYDIRMRGCDTRRLGQSFPYMRSLVVLNSIFHSHYRSSASIRMWSSNHKVSNSNSHLNLQ